MGTARLAEGGQVAYALTGSGPFLLDAASGRTLVRYHRPGCGLSDPCDGPRTMSLEIATITAVMEALDVTRRDAVLPRPTQRITPCPNVH